MHFSFIFLLDLLGTAVFAISGAFLAMEKKLDIFGMLVLAFVTAIGGGTVRDVLIGNTPVTWLRDLTTPTTILVAAIVARLFKGSFRNLNKTLVFFDALGLGLFTVTGIQKGLAAGIHPALCVALGTITGCFGGVLRDLLVREIPVLFQRTEFYATACIAGGILYFLLLQILPAPVAQSGAIICICLLRILAVRYNWRLPSA
ncbi:trimeric intracellular cation channel family protein [Mucilaginibacter sp. AW1-3]